MVEEFPRPRNGRQTSPEAPVLLREGGPEAGGFVLSPDAGDGPGRVFLPDAPGAQGRRDAAVPAPSGGFRAGQLGRRRRLVEETGAREQVQSSGDLGRLVTRAEELSLQLAPRVRPTAQKRERRRPAIPARPAARSFAQGEKAYGWLEKSKGDSSPSGFILSGAFKAPSMTSCERSDVDWTPWILSLNSFGFVDRRIASSRVMRPER